LMDKEFTFKYGRKQTGVRHGLLVHNQARQLLLTCWTERKARYNQETSHYYYNYYYYFCDEAPKQVKEPEMEKSTHPLENASIKASIS